MVGKVSKNLHKELISIFFYGNKTKWHPLEKKKLFVLSAKILLLLFVNLVREMGK